jgi:hypothetical protein
MLQCRVVVVVEVVASDYLAAALAQLRNEVRADEAGSAGNEDGG